MALSQPIFPASWLPSNPRSHLTIYVDGSSVPNPGRSGVGMLVLATEQGTTLVYSCLQNIGHSDSKHAELVGLHNALRLVAEAAPATSLILSDCLVAINAVLHSSSHFRRFVQDLPPLDTTGLQVGWLERRRNLAHHLARSAADLSPYEEHVAMIGGRTLPGSDRQRLAA